MRDGSEELITLLSSGLSRRKLYFSTHPRVIEAGQEFSSRLEGMLGGSDKDRFFLGVVDGHLIHEGKYLVGPTIVGRRLVRSVENLRSGGLLFHRGIGAHEICELLGLVAELNEPVESLEEARGMLRSRGVTHIELSPVYHDPEWFGRYLFDREIPSDEEMKLDETTANLVAVCQALYHAVEVANQRAAGDHALDIDEVRHASARLAGTTGTAVMDLMRHVRYPDYDTYTIGHSVRVALLAVLVARRLGANRDLLAEIGTCGLLHDVGKAKIPDEILYRADRLSEEERRIVENHPNLGAQILLENRNTSLLAVTAAWGHHLRADRKGYPHSADWAVGSAVTSLLHVCDVFEALTAVRPYKRAFSPRRAYEIMVGDTGAFEPGALAAVVEALGFYPPGSRVALSGGRLAVVHSAGEQLDRPRVRVTTDERGQPLPPGSEEDVDLAEEGPMGLRVEHLLVD